ncbi:MAG TPA: c-type cytochrome [Chitinophagaceae bacterium]|nr:c-type cytochrome [Chitinophagaceae bacterium]
MKKLFTLLSMIFIITACKSKDSTGGDITKSSVYIKGIALVEKNKCMTCHFVDQPLTGPSYRDIANKYAGASKEKIDELAQKVITGGTGVWGEIFMTQHPDVSPEDARAMVKYILLLKN